MEKLSTPLKIFAPTDSKSPLENHEGLFQNACTVYKKQKVIRPTQL